MYTVSKGPSKIVAKTRRGISQNLERLDTLRDARKSTDFKEDQDYVVNSPKPVFHMPNGKKSSHNRYHQEVVSPQHEEIIKFVYDSWTTVCRECDLEPQEDGQSPQPPSPVYYDGEPNGSLQDFKPFDLESWWGKRLFNNITKSIP
ncbi:hypothetical protein ONE63_000124 [Megalurothrips usitatus]|uniref:MAPK regulated corepressor interacting protein 2 n=1 Tax=Megalurothrips usitatus TaxID=439358 RepID=A0AAV7Y1C3_9NEOP|nr:hypothetical protein ONE63_000124 [Megalurothrips usitatus]